MPPARKKDEGHLEAKIDILSDKMDAQATSHARLDERLSNHLANEERTSERMEGQLESVNSHLFGIKEILGKQQASIDEHIRRTDILEGAVKPLVEQRQQFEGFFKFAKVALKIGALITALGAGGFGIKQVIALIFKL